MPARVQLQKPLWEQEGRRETVGGNFDLALTAATCKYFRPIQAGGMPKHNMTELVRTGESLDPQRALGRDHDSWH
jgi:hypothetical protein